VLGIPRWADRVLCDRRGLRWCPRAERFVQPATQLDEVAAACRESEHLGAKVEDRAAAPAAVMPTSA
jgi:hypothetical protein